jgi:hypothetical protein
MKEPPMTLEDVGRVLFAQDRQLQAAFGTPANRSIALPLEALERLGRACEAPASYQSTSKPSSGIRC